MYFPIIRFSQLGLRANRNLSGKREKRHQDIKMAEIHLVYFDNVHKYNYLIMCTSLNKYIAMTLPLIENSESSVTIRVIPVERTKRQDC